MGAQERFTKEITFMLRPESRVPVKEEGGWGGRYSR